jgi:hypothetical protein
LSQTQDDRTILLWEGVRAESSLDDLLGLIEADDGSLNLDLADVLVSHLHAFIGWYRRVYGTRHPKEKVDPFAHRKGVTK